MDPRPKFCRDRELSLHPGRTGSRETLTAHPARHRHVHTTHPTPVQPLTQPGRRPPTRTRSKAEGVPPRCTWPSTVTRVSKPSLWTTSWLWGEMGGYGLLCHPLPPAPLAWPGAHPCPASEPAGQPGGLRLSWGSCECAQVRFPRCACGCVQKFECTFMGCACTPQPWTCGPGHGDRGIHSRWAPGTVQGDTVTQ